MLLSLELQILILIRPDSSMKIISDNNVIICLSNKHSAIMTPRYLRRKECTYKTTLINKSLLKSLFSAYVHFHRVSTRLSILSDVFHAVLSVCRIGRCSSLVWLLFFLLLKSVFLDNKSGSA